MAKEAYVPPGECPLCNGPITDRRRVGSSDGPEGGDTWYSGICAVCDVDFGLTLRRGIEPVWRLKAPDASHLLERVAEEELEALCRKLQKYATLGPKWQRFLDRRREGDEVWRYRHPYDGVTCITVVRSGRPVSNFSVFGSL
jgi:hypothetical protein